MWTRPTSLADTPARSSAALMAVAPSLGAVIDESEPKKEPIAVRAAPTMTTSRMPKAYRQIPEFSTMAPGSLDESGHHFENAVYVVYRSGRSKRKPHGFTRLCLAQTKSEKDS